MAITIVFPEREGGAVVDIQTAVEGAQAAQAAAEAAQAAAEAAAEDAEWPTPSAWLTATAYSAAAPSADLVTYDGELYVCLVSHTSGTFSTDLAASKWLKIVSKGATGATGATGPTGPTGPAGAGDDGWSPVFDVTGTGVERTLTITDWTGGAGTKPSTGDVGVIVDAASVTPITDAVTDGIADLVAQTASGVAEIAGTPGSTMYADNTAGLAGTSSGAYFLRVETGDKVATVVLDNAGVAVDQEAYPSYDFVAAAGYLANTYKQTWGEYPPTGGWTSQATGGQAATNIILFGTTIENNATAITGSVYVYTTGTIRFVICSTSGSTHTVVAEQDVVFGATGHQTFTLNATMVAAALAGRRIGWQARTASIVGFFSGNTDYTYYNGGTVGASSFTDSSLSGSNTNLLIHFKVTMTEQIAKPARPYSVNLPAARMGVLIAGRSLATGTVDDATTVQEYDTLCAPSYDNASDPPFILLPAIPVNANNKEHPGFGLAHGIRNALLEDNNLSYTDVKSQIILFENAEGGQPIANLEQGTAPYAFGIDQITKAAERLGPSFVVLGVAWYGGEGVTDVAAYAASLIQLATDYDADIRAITGQTQRVKFIINQDCFNDTNWYNAFLGQYLASQNSDLIELSGNCYDVPYQDTAHVDEFGTRAIGSRAGRALKHFAIDGNREPYALIPRSISVSGAVVTIQYHRTDIEFDTTTIAAQTKYGFYAETAGGSAITISDTPTVIGDGRVRFTLASTPAAGDFIGYGLPDTGIATANIYAGNLRDNAGDRRVIDSIALHNWGTFFKYKI